MTEIGPTKLAVRIPSQGNLWYKSIDFIHRLKKSGSVRFHSDLLIRLYGGSYKKQVITPLVEAGIISVNNSYKVGDYSKRYTLIATDYENWIDSTIRYKCADGAHVFSKYVKPLIGLPNDVNALITSHVQSKINRSTITVSPVDEFEGSIYQDRQFVPVEMSPLYETPSAQVYTYGSYSVVTASGIELALTELRSILGMIYMWQVDFINLGDYYVSRGKKSRRIYHPVSTLPKVVREGITLDGEKLVQIDMKNAQFALWAYGLDKPIKWELHARIGKDAQRHLPFLDYGKDLVAEKAFTNAAKQGTLYEYMSAVLNEHNRELTKKKVFQSLFGALHHTHNEYDALTTHIPNVVKKIKLHRRDSKHNLAVSLQNLEAAIFIDYLLPNLVYRGMPCIPVHDCLLVKESHKEQAIHLIRKLLQEIELKATFDVNGKDKFNTIGTSCSLVSKGTSKAIAFEDLALSELHAEYLTRIQ